MEQYVKAAWTSSTRARFVLIVIVTASILTFAAFWNSQPKSWMNSRIHLARIAAVACSSNWSNGAKVSLRTEDQVELFARSKEYYDNRHFESCDQLTEHVRQLQDIQARQVNLIQVPVFGVVLDVNDLGTLGGFTFVILLLWFRFSIARELSNLRLVFEVAGEAGPDKLQRCYDLLSMRQVLTVPPSRHPTGHPFWRGLPLVLYVLPFAVQLTVFINDICTFDLGWSVSHLNTIALLIASSMCLVVGGILTYLSFVLTRNVMQEWDKAARTLKII